MSDTRRLKENDTVIITRNGYEGKTGIIKRVVIPDEFFIVRCEDGELVKCTVADIIIHKQEENPDTITINREDFIEVVAKTIASVARENDARDPIFTMAIGLTGTVIGKRLTDNLFNKGER